MKTFSTDEQIIQEALAIMERRARFGEEMNTPQACARYFQFKIACLEHEEFHVAFLDAQHRVIAFEAMFRGTLTQASIYPREVVKRALAWNAAGIICAHNHPSGNPTPSEADELLTRQLEKALALVDVNVLDHFVVTKMKCSSIKHPFNWHYVSLVGEV